MYARLRCGGNLPQCLAFGTGVLGVLWWLGGWVVGIRYRRGPPMVRNMRAVLKKASWGTRRIFRRLRCAKTGFYGTEEIFGVKNSLLWYAKRFQRPTEQPTPQTVDSLLPHRTHFQCAKRPRSDASRLKRG